MLGVSSFTDSTSWGVLHSKDEAKVFRSYLLSNNSPFLNNKWPCTDLPNWGLAFLRLDLWWLVKPSIGPCLLDWIFSASPFDCGTLSSSHGIEPYFEPCPPWPRVSNPKRVSVPHRCYVCHNMSVWGLTSQFPQESLLRFQMPVWKAFLLLVFLQSSYRNIGLLEALQAMLLLPLQVELWLA